MRFAFTEEQRLLRDAVADLLEQECTAQDLRAARDHGFDAGRWAALADLGLTALTVPDEHGGIGMDEIALVGCLEEAGRAALPEPLGDVAAVVAPLLAQVGGPVADRWLPAIASGDAVVLPALTDDRLLPAAAPSADLLLLADGEAVHAVEPDAVTMTARPGVDRTRQPVRIDWEPDPATRIAAAAGEVLADAADRGALAAAAELVGLTATMLDLATGHADTREQFGRPIGSFQAVKHRLADAFVRLEFVRPVVYRAAHSLATDAATRRRDTSMAKLHATAAAEFAAKAALQVHGAIGYTEEHDLHLWMNRTWALAPRWGGADHHRDRVAAAVLAG